MNLSQLRPAAGSKKNRKRVGRGPGSGTGKTAGKGSKGQLQGAGYSRMRAFEGGQMPLARRVPKRGFTNIFREAYAEINLDRLDRIAKAEIGPEDLVAAGLVSRRESGRVKILGRGAMTSAKSVSAHRFSESARTKIEEAGGKALVIGKR
jgi:large subunit ribosomal protein L15